MDHRGLTNVKYNGTGTEKYLALKDLIISVSITQEQQFQRSVTCSGVKFH